MDAALAIATSSLGTGLEKAGIVVAALLAAVAVLARPVRARALATAGALVLTPALLLVEVWDTPQLKPLRDHPLYTLVGGLIAIAAVCVVAWLFSRWPALFPILAVAALPFRLPIQTGGQTANLLVPLYFVIGAGALAWLVPRLRGKVEPDERPRGRLEWALLGFVVLYAVQSTYSLDFTKALDQVVFFYVPFALLFMLLSHVEWDGRLLKACFVVLLGLAVIFAAIGFVEFATREVLFNPKVIRTNEFASYFRVNSLFFDPNIYGRFLAIVAILTTAVMLWSQRRRDVLLCAGALVVLLAALLTTLSQSSLGALLLGLVVLAALRWSIKWTVGLTAGVVIVGLGAVLAFPGVFHVDLSQKRLDKISTGRVSLIKGGAQLFADKPIAGWGAASFPKAFERQGHGSQARAVSASHTIPLTVAAEQGALGLLVYLALLVCALWRLFAGSRATLARMAVAAAFAALLLHTFLYASFLEDPATWALLGVGTALAPVGARRMRPAELAQAAAEAHAKVSAVTVFWVLVPTYPALDSYYALVWGREALHGHDPTFVGYRAPTHHPLWVLVGGLLSLFGGDADRLLVLVALWCLVLFLWGLYRLGAKQFGVWVGVAAAAFGASSFAFLLYAVRAFVDIPFLAAVVWAGVLALPRPSVDFGADRARNSTVDGSRPVAAMAVLAVAGLLRPEAWLLAGLLWLWTIRRAAPRDRMLLTVLLLIAPLAWLAIDAATTNDALFSFHATSSLADELRHSGGAAQVPGALVGYLDGTLRAPVVLLGLVGVALALWRYGPKRLAVPLALLLAGVLTFVIAGLAGFSLIQRYLTVPAAALCLFAGYALLGFTTLPPGDRIRRGWTRVAAVVGALGVLVAAVLAVTSVGRVRTELTFVRDSHDDLVAILHNPEVKAARRCGPITFPSDRLIPDARWILDAPRVAVLARTAPGRRPYGVELFVSGFRALDRFGFAAGIPARTNLPDPGYRLVARNRTFDAWTSCPRSAPSG